MRIGAAGARQYYTNSGAPAELIKYSQTFDPYFPFLPGAKCPKFWPKFRHQSSSDRRVFELGRFIGKQKQTCQGPLIVYHHTKHGVGGCPQLPEPLAQWVPQKVIVENFLYKNYPPFQRPTPSTPPLMLYTTYWDRL